MSYVFNAGLWGIVLILVLSFMMTPLVCNSIKQENPSVSCSIYDDMDIFTRLYTNIYSLPLIILGFVAGSLTGRTISLIRKRYEMSEDKLLRKIEKKESPWPWENH